MEDFRPEIKKGNIVIKKKNVIQKVADAFIVKSFNEVAVDVKEKVLKPTIKNLIITAGNSILTGLLYDGSIPQGTILNNVWNNTWSRPLGTMINYNYSGFNKPQQSQQDYIPAYLMSYEDILVQPIYAEGETMQHAEIKARSIITAMYDLLERYKKVRISDLFDLCGQIAPTTYGNYGWKDLTGADIKAVQGGFKFVLPRPVPLN